MNVKIGYTVQKISHWTMFFNANQTCGIFTPQKMSKVVRLTDDRDSVKIKQKWILLVEGCPIIYSVKIGVEREVIEIFFSKHIRLLHVYPY